MFSPFPNTPADPSRVRSLLRPSLPAPLPPVGAQVLVRFTAGAAAAGVVEEVNPAPLGGLVTVAMPALGPDRSRSRVSMVVPGWAVTARPE